MSAISILQITGEFTVTSTIAIYYCCCTWLLLVWLRIHEMLLYVIISLYLHY
jgi:hypothetical protein